MADVKALAEELVNLSVKDVQELAKVLKEEYDMDDFNGLSDEEYDELQQKFVDAYEREDQEMKDDYESSIADMMNHEDWNYDPSDGDLYRGMY